MKYLIDTNVISELVKATPNNEVYLWFNSIPNSDLYLSVLTLGEIRKGVSKIQDASKREKIRIWLEYDLPTWFNGRILSIDIDIANRWGVLQNQCNKPLPTIDSLIAATALHFDLIMVTRNIQDFQYPGLEVLNPWKL